MRSLGIAVLLLTACYRYAPVTSAAIVPGANVRLSLSRPTTDSGLAAVLGAEATALEGRLLAATDSGWTVAVSATLKRGAANPANRTVWAGEPVTIPRAAVSGIELRALDRRKTTRAIALGTVGAVLLVRLLVHVVSSSSGGNDGEPVVTPP